jgi:predicted kinase
MPKLIIICGVSFAGKSMLGVAIARRFGYEQVDLDDTKFSLYGPDVCDEDLSRSDWERIYDSTYRAICEYLRAGESIVDGSGNFRRSERQTVRELADPARDEIVTIYVDTPAQIARQRLLANRDTRARLDVTDEGFEHILRSWEPPSPDEHARVFHYGEDIGAWLDAHESLSAPQ